MNPKKRESHLVNDMSDSRNRTQPGPECVRIQHETLGKLPVDVHWIDTADGVRIALTHVAQGEGRGHGTPVVLVHGNYTNRGFWISRKGFGLAPFLVEAGYDAWIVELRGHGLSPKGPGFSSITAEDHIRKDLPAALTYVQT